MGEASLSRRRAAQRILVPSALYLIAALLAAVFLLPFYWMIVGSLKDFAAFYALPPRFIPNPAHWENYREILLEFPLLRFVSNSVFVGLSITFGQLLVASLAGYAFATMDFFGKRVLFMVFLSGMMVPISVILIPLYFIVNRMGLVDTYGGLILPCIFSGYGIFLMRQFLLTVPRELHDASVVDGSPEFRTYWSIYVPLSKPVFVTLGIQCFVYFYNAFLWPLIVINSEWKKTVPAGLIEFVGRDQQWPHLIMAGATISIVPTIIVFMVLQRYYVRGISTTGLKA